MSISPIDLLSQTNNNSEQLIIMSNNELLQKQALNVMEVIEDSVEMLCDEYLLSGEKVWTMIGALSDYKLQEFPLDEED